MKVKSLLVVVAAGAAALSLIGNSSFVSAAPVSQGTLATSGAQEFPGSWKKVSKNFEGTVRIEAYCKKNLKPRSTSMDIRGGGAGTNGLLPERVESANMGFTGDRRGVFVELTVAQGEKMKVRAVAVCSKKGSGL